MRALKPATPFYRRHELAAGYQANADLMIFLNGMTHLAGFGTAAFV